MVRFCEIIVDFDIALFQKRDQKTDYLILTNVVYMMREVTIENVLKVINESLEVNVDAKHIYINLQTLGMDSMMFIEIIIRLESEFGCEIPDSKLLIMEMDTVYKMYAVLKEIDKIRETAK
jgi:acyl carrier protein